MKVAVLGANCSLFAEAMSQAVVPATGLPSASAQLKAAPPHAWTSIPRCRMYQACSAGASFALKKMPPMPVTRFIGPPRSGGGEGAVCRQCCRSGWPTSSGLLAGRGDPGGHGELPDVPHRVLCAMHQAADDRRRELCAPHTAKVAKCCHIDAAQLRDGRVNSTG